jgi:lysozyme
MNISDAGIDFITSFEGKLKKLPDDRYIAYRCPANVLTIYAGCTEGVTEGMIVTEDEGRAMFRRELAKHEAAVRRLVTVDLTQGQFDALVSFSYNVGSGALQKSTLLKHLNAGDYARAASHFADYKKAGGKVLKGLVRRRAAEAAMFMEDEEPTEMVQKVDKPDTKMKVAEVISKVALPTGVVAGGGATVATKPALPKIDPKAAIQKGKEHRETLEAAKDLGTWAKGFGTWAAGDGLIVCLGLAAVAAVVVVIPKIKERF